MNYFTFTFAIGMVCALAQDGVTTPVTCSEVLTISDCTSGSSFYTDLECGLGEDIDDCNTENCCGVIGTGGCVPDWIANGLCDLGNNNAACGNYDGGDCCDFTCMDEQFPCGFVGFDCRDPSANDVDELLMGPCDTPCLEKQ